MLLADLRPAKNVSGEKLEVRLTMKNICKTAIFILFIVASLTACDGNNSRPEPGLIEVSETATSATTIPEKNIPITPKPDQQVYTDPEGWYSVNFPANLGPTDKENRFSKESSFFETGYLPDMGYMSSAQNVCAWLANVTEEEPENFVVNFMSSGHVECSISTKPDVSRQVIYEIFENPKADIAHRFVYVKTGWYSPGIVPGSTFRTDFSWLQPINDAKYEPKLSPVTREEITEWGKIAPILQNISVTEYALPPGSNPYQEMLVSSLPDEALPDWARKDYSASKTKTPEPEKMTLMTLGYELETEMIKISSGQYPRKRLYRDGRLLFDYIFDVSEIYSFSTEEGILTAFVVVTRNIEGGQYHAFLVQNDAIIEWDDSHQDPPFAPILYQGKPLWLKVNKDWQHVQVVKSDSESLKIIYSFSVYTEPMYSTKEFVSWNGHWVWAARDFLIQDGEILNERLGFQEIFQWKLIDDKPAYLFRKDGRVGFSYDGKIIPLEYQEVARYMCCGYSVNNPSLSDDSAHFFAERNGIWYYVVLKFR